MISNTNIFHIHAEILEKINWVCFQYSNHSRSVHNTRRIIHLFKLSCSESEVSRSNFVTERLAYHAIPNGIFCVILWTFLKLTNIPCAVSGLRRFLILSLLLHLKCLKHKIKLTNSCEVRLTTFWAREILFSEVYFSISSLLSRHEICLPSFSTR